MSSQPGPGRFTNNSLWSPSRSVSVCLPIFHVITTSAPLLYYVRTWCIPCNISSTTHPFQLTDTINELQKTKRKRNKGGLKKNAQINSDEVQRTHTYNYQNNHDHYVYYQHANTSLQTTFHLLITPRQHPLNTRNKEKQNINRITILEIITISTFNINIQIDHFNTKSHILNTLPTYKYMHFNQNSCV